MTLHRRLLLLAAFLLSSTIVLPAFSQIAGPDTVLYRPAVERSFQEALRQFEDHHFRTALDAFQRIVDLSETTHRTSASYLMGAKSL